MRVYLAGPMRGLPDNNGPAFADAARRLREMGHEVWSPAEHDELLTVTADRDFLRRVFRRDLLALLDQEALVLLPGWSRSEGARLERYAALTVRMPVYDWYPGTGLLVSHR